ncbi:MAG: alpha-glycosidase, partial [bacterium]|nr:alpha-glycosidase [bacterium]
KVGRVEQLGFAAASEGVSVPVLREAVTMLMTWPGAPTLYYGDEAGVCGFTDPDNRRTYPWDNPNRELIEFHKQIIAIHKREKALRTGSFKMLWGEYGYLAYARFTRTEQLVVLINNSNEVKDVKQKVRDAGIPFECELDRLMITSEEGFSFAPIRYPVSGGKIEVVMPAHSAAIFKRR